MSFDWIGFRREHGNAGPAPSYTPLEYTWLAVLSLLALAALYANRTFIIDDAFITFRYSRHWAEGLGPIWNRTGDPVEGFTNALLMALATAGIVVGLDPLTVARGLAVAATFLILRDLLITVRSFSGGRGAALMATSALALFMPTYLHAMSGLETSIYAWLILRMGIELLAEPPPSGAGTWRLPLVTLCAGMLRPEGAAVGGVALAFWWQKQRKSGVNPRVMPILAYLVVPGVIYFVTRWSFYGWPLPNTFYVKIGHFRAGLAWLARTLVLPLFPMIVLFALSGRSRHATDLRRLIILAVVNCVPYFLSDLMMDYADRFAFHVLPLLCLAVGLAIGSTTHLATVSRWRRHAFVSAAFALLPWTIFTGVRDAPPSLLLEYQWISSGYIPFGEALRRSPVPEASRTMAIGDAGIIAYLSDWRVIDFIGLNDEEIAHGKDRTAKIKEVKPTLLVLYSEDGVSPRSFQYGLAVPELLSEYDIIGSLAFEANYQPLVYLRKDVPEPVRRELERLMREVRAARPPPSETSYRNWLALARRGIGRHF